MNVDKSGRRIREMFGETSSRYDFLNHFLSRGVDYYWRWRTVRAVAPSGTDPILDVCTGTGDLAIAYWKRGRGRLAVTGSDFTHNMLQIAEAKRERTVPPADEQSLSFLEADTLQLPFAYDWF